MEYSKVNIYCPKCKRKIGQHDGKGKIHIEIKCNNCNKLIIYIPETKERLVRPLPERATSSGLRFY